MILIRQAGYDNGWIDMLYIDSNFRGTGASSTLLKYLESLCKIPKLFTSTNLSNLPIQSLLGKMGYILSGVIHNLDEDDPEIVYFKRLWWKLKALFNQNESDRIVINYESTTSGLVCVGGFVFNQRAEFF